VVVFFPLFFPHDFLQCGVMWRDTGAKDLCEKSRCLPSVISIRLKNGLFSVYLERELFYCQEETSMNQRLRVAKILLLLFGLHCSTAWAGTTGKIAGTITDKQTGEPLPSANVVIMGSAMGAAADLDGNYSILYIPPGNYNIQISMMGYSKVTITDVRVQIDQTARVNAAMQVETIQGEVVTVVGERMSIRPDVATSVVSVTPAEIEELPVINVQSVVELQAGIQSGMEIRGGGADEALFLIDGATLRDPRNNNPISSLALSSVKEISVERGGFNAEYGQVRSGIVNIVTKEGTKSGYHGKLELKYSPPGAKNFGISPFDKNSWWLRPYYDNEVCWTGTKGEPFEDLNSNLSWDKDEPFTDINKDGRWTGWDKYTQRQYPEFEGWNSISQKLLSDNDPSNDLTAYGAQRVFEYETRKQPPLNQPDYNIDTGFGGPVPVIAKKLGDLRFFTSFRRNREMLLVPLTRDDYVDYDWSLKLQSDITPSMKLMVSGFMGKQYTMQENWSYNYLRYPEEIAGIFGDRPGPLFGTGYFSLADIGYNSVAAKLTNFINPSTFYEISLEHLQRDYFARPGTRRNLKQKFEIVPGYFVDEAPFGYDPDDQVGIAGMLFGGFVCKRRDNTDVSSTTLKMDLSSQLNFNNLAKAGIEFVYNDLNFDYGIIANYSASRYDEHVQFNAKPLRAALYLQDKLEAKGFIMNLGLRLDYSNSNTDWWNVDPYNNNFFSSKYNNNMQFSMIKSKSQWQWSPRLGISHPITENSKLFFNYGHFKQMPSYETLFRIGRASDNAMANFGDPNLILAKTISYELGYDHSLFNALLLQLSAFYHDISDQQDATTFTSIGGIVYNRTTSNSYEDIRGFEVSLKKNRGLWWTYFVNYTYQVSTSGHFGREQVYQDPSKQKQYDEATVNLYQDRPIPRPYARANLTFYTPDGFGPKVGSLSPLGGYTLNFLLNWQAGEWVTYNPKDITSMANNVQRTDFINAILRFGKKFTIDRFRIYAFVDVNNLFNVRRMSLSNMQGEGMADDRTFYYDSLHLPSNKAYDNIPGDDKIGSYRKQGVAYQPMFWRGQINYDNDIGENGVIYYDKATKRYVEYVDAAWKDVNRNRLDKILKDKAYIDMPDQSSFSFLNPRQIFFGVQLSFELD
jgi:outer membrane receptor protein involved in Fe transport